LTRVALRDLRKEAVYGVVLHGKGLSVQKNEECGVAASDYVKKTCAHAWQRTVLGHCLRVLPVFGAF
jgi:hypothetical protein